MAHPQVGLFALGTSAHAYLEFDLTSEALAERLVTTAAGSGPRTNQPPA
jgi:hypothetical protein